MGAAGQELLFPLPVHIRPACSRMPECGHLTLSSWVNAAVAVAGFLGFFLFSMSNEYDHALWLFRV